MVMNAQNESIPLALLRQDLERLRSMCEPTNIDGWNPSANQRSVYSRLLFDVLNRADNIETEHQRLIADEGAIHHFVPDSHLDYFRNVFRPRREAMKRALAVIDPEGFEDFQLLEGSGAPVGRNGQVKETFEAGIEKVQELIESWPGMEESFDPDIARKVLNSGLIEFDPDAWLDRSRALRPVLTNNQHQQPLPGHVRIRIRELFRSYTFGNWLAVMALARATLEYALRHNARKFRIELQWPVTRGPGRKKRLEELINDYADHFPKLRDDMDRVRDLGNKHLHPEAKDIGIRILERRERDAREVIQLLVPIIEEVYLSRQT